MLRYIHAYKCVQMARQLSSFLLHISDNVACTRPGTNVNNHNRKPMTSSGRRFREKSPSFARTYSVSIFRLQALPCTVQLPPPRMSASFCLPHINSVKFNGLSRLSFLFSLVVSINVDNTENIKHNTSFHYSIFPKTRIFSKAFKSNEIRQDQ